MVEREVKVFCACGHQYIVMLPDVAGNRPIPPIEETVHEQCPRCARDIRDAQVLAGHSGGTFNAAAVRGPR